MKKKVGLSLDNEIDLREEQPDISKRAVEIQCQLEELYDSIYWMTDPHMRGTYYENLGKRRWGNVDHATKELNRALAEIKRLEALPKENQ